MREIERRYMEALAHIPAPGKGCHPALLGVANYAVMAGRSDAEALAEIRAAIPPGQREVPDEEICEALDRARQDSSEFEAGGAQLPPIHKPHRTVADIRAQILKDETIAAKLRRAVIAAGGGELDPFGADVRESSPIPLEDYSEAYPYAAEMIPLLGHLYRPDDILFIGRQYDAGRDNLKPAAEWVAFFEDRLARIAELPPEQQQHEFERLGELYPLIMPNPHTGRPGPTKKGDKESWRADSCVAEFRYIVAEFDGMSFNEQGATLRGLCREAGLQIGAVIFSGGKSCHAWIRCEGITTAEEWETQVKRGLFPVLRALGADTACSNPSRLSRLPGVFRADKGAWQQLLFLAPEGGML